MNEILIKFLFWFASSGGSADGSFCSTMVNLRMRLMKAWVFTRTNWSAWSFRTFFLGFRMGTHDDIYNGTRRRIFAQFYFNFFFFCIHQQPETIPQASINMSDVIEVADAEQITGHTNSILIQTPDCSTFVKGTCQEESKWWCNVLVQLVKSKVRHHKRNAFLKGQNQKCEFHFVFDWSASRSPRCGEERELCGNWVT